MATALPLTLKDLEAQAPKAPQVVQKIKDTHHQLARLVAEGRKIVEISEITGYSPGHIRQLEADPAFQELIVHYKAVVNEKFSYVQERIAGLASDTLQEIHTRLNEDPAAFSVASLTELAKVTLDRSGFGPTKTVNSTSISAQVTADDLARIRAQRTSGGVRQIGQKEKPISAPDPGPDLLPVIDATPSVNSEVPAAGLEGGGHQVREEVRGEDAGGTREEGRVPRPVGGVP